MNVLIVLTSHDKLGNTGKKTGFWLEEFAAPYYVFKDAGLEITLASPKGGQPPIDPNSEKENAQTAATRRFIDDEEALYAMANTNKLASVNADDYDAVYYPGGHGPMWDLYSDKASIALIEAFVADGKPVAAVCHAPAALLNARTPEGYPLVKDKQVTALSNDEEGYPDDVPFLLENQLMGMGANYQKSGKGQPKVITDGLLITGQNPASSEGIAKALLKALSVN